METVQKSLDKIHEVYMGDNASVFTQKTRERIHWICGQVIGQEILDIGCSQGTIPLLLGKSGKHVLGIDVEEEAIAYANNLLAKETSEVQQNISFQCNDILMFSSHSTYDTIILTEVLEHILDIDAILKKILSLGNENSKIIITVPFGISDFWDHKRTYYFAGLYEQLIRYFVLADVRFFENWIGVICRKHQSNELQDKVSFVDISLINAEEDAFYKRERSLINDRDRYKKAYQEQKELTYKAREEIGALKEQLRQSKNDIVKWKERATVLQEQTGNLKEKLDLGKNDITRWKKRSETLQEQVENLKNKVEKCKSDTAKWKERAEALQEKLKK